MRIHKLESNVGGKASAARARKSAARPGPVKPAPPRVTLGVIVGNRG